MGNLDGIDMPKIGEFGGTYLTIDFRVTVQIVLRLKACIYSLAAANNWKPFMCLEHLFDALSSRSVIELRSRPQVHSQSKRVDGRILDSTQSSESL